MIRHVALAASLSLTAASLLASTARADEPPSSGGSADCPEPVVVRRAHSDESATLQLVDCEGKPVPESLDELSILARPNGTPRPSPEVIAVYQTQAPTARTARFVSPGVHRLDPGLLTRLQAIATRFGDRALEIVSGYRPQARRGSRHRVGRALDVRVEGIDRREVAEFARGTLEASGVGYYPNSTFTHIDVRERAHAWMDLSAPGESPRYVAWSEDDVDGEGSPSSGDVVDHEEPAEAIATVSEPAPASPAAIADEDTNPTGSVYATNEPAAAADADEVPMPAAPATSVPVLPRELDDDGQPIDIGASIAAVRSLVEEHDRQAQLAREPGQPARDENVDWTVPWWTTTRRAAIGAQGRETSTSME